MGSNNMKILIIRLWSQSLALVLTVQNGRRRT